MDKRDKNSPKANKPIREDDHIENTDLPYDPNINSEDLQALHDENLSMDQGQDKFLADRDRPADFTADELDIPGADDADTTHRGTDNPDEENYQFDNRGAPKKRSKEEEIPDPDSLTD